MTHNLPSNWTIDASLKHFVPAHLDYRTFKRIPENPNRYAACIIGSGVLDLHTGRFLQLVDKDPSARKRYRISLGRNTKPRTMRYSRIITMLVFGPPLQPTDEAHHVDEDPTNDHWENLRWQTPEQNLALSNASSKRRLGEQNGRTTIPFDQLIFLVESYDTNRRLGKKIDLSLDAVWLGVSERQLKRILSGNSRVEDVARARELIAQRHAQKASAAD